MDAIPRKSNYMPSIKMQKLVKSIKTFLTETKLFCKYVPI